jgi:hypothetical protein
MVASASMSFRTPTASQTFHYLYNSPLAYESALLYEATGTNGSASMRIKLASAMGLRSVATSGMAARNSTTNSSSMNNRSVTSATMKGR